MFALFEDDFILFVRRPQASPPSATLSRDYKHLKPSKTKTGAPARTPVSVCFKIYFFVDSNTGRMAVPMQALGIWMLSRAHTVAAMSTILVGW